MSVMEGFWNAIPGPEALDSEANIEQRFVLPLLEALGYDRAVDIESKYPVEFKQGRVGRKPEADFVCFYGPLRDRSNSLLVVEAKAAGESLPLGKAQGESYAQNLRAPLLLMTNGRDVEIWQQQATLESQCVLKILIVELTTHRGKIESLLNKGAVRDYCAALKFKTIVQAIDDFGGYEAAELARLKADPPAVARTLTLHQLSGTNSSIESVRLLEDYSSGGIVVGPSGYGKTTLSRSIFKQAIEERWRGRHNAVAIEAPLPDMEGSESDFLQFLLQRLQAHKPGLTEASFRELLRTTGVTVVCDSLDRTSHTFQKRAAAAISLFLRDYPLSQVFIFSRADAKPTIKLPTLELAPLSDMQMRELENVILSDDSAQHYSVMGAAPPTLRSLCSNPLLLKLALEYWLRFRDFPRDIDILFRSWLETVLETEPNDPVSRLRREKALSIIAQATTDAPLIGVKAVTLLRGHGIDETVLNELIQCGAVRENNAVLDVRHDSLADYLRAKAFAEMSVPDQIAAIPGVPTSPGSFFSVLLMAQLADAGAQDALWRHLVSGPVDTYFDALRYRRDASEEFGRLEPQALSFRYMTDLLNGIEEPLEGFFPALKRPVLEWLTDERDKPLAVIGTANLHSLFYKIQAQEPGAPRISVGAPDFPGTIRGVDLDLSRYRADSARLLGMSLLKKTLREVVSARNVDGGPVWAAERLIGRIRYLKERYLFPISTDSDLSGVEEVLRPYAAQVLREGPLTGEAHFYFQSMLDDAAKLRTAGVTTLDPWWLRLGWNDDLSSVSDQCLAELLDEEYRRTQVIYAEIVETSFSHLAKEMMFFPILPLRWKLRVSRGGLHNQSFIVYPQWTPVKDWTDAGADVIFVDRGPDGFPPWEEARDALTALGRAPNVPRYGGFSTHAGYGGSQLNSCFTGATPAANEAISWLKDELDRLFRNLPSGDGSFAV